MLKNLFSALAVVLLLAGAASAQPMYFNTNTAGGANVIPFNSIPPTWTQTQKTQWCIPAGSMGSVPAGHNITTVYFQAGSTANMTYPIFTIKLKTGNASTGLTGVTNGPFEAGMTLVYSGVNELVTTSTGNWFSFTLQTPFLFDPTLPLYVEIDQNATSGTGPTVYQAVSITGPGNGRQYGAYNSSIITGGVGPSQVNFGIDVFPATPCSGAPPANSVSPLSFTTCPGISNPGLKFASSYSLSGLTYQWYSSTSSAYGPFTPVNGYTLSTAPVPTLGVTTWFQAVATCTNAPVASTTLSASEFYVISGTVVDNAPYYEDFEGIAIADRLPNCSWYSAELGATAKTYMSALTGNRLPRSGSKFASFSNNPAGTSHYFTNGINLEPGITYSASMWYQTDLTGANNWTDLSLSVNTSQSAAGATTIASTGGPAVSILYKHLSGTFTVSTPGVYYIGVNATGAAGTAQYLSWDDLSIEIPCSLNTPTIAINASNNSVCAGDNVVLTGSGADSFMWDNNAGQGSVVTVNPLHNTLYTAIGSNTISGCSATASQFISVNPAPMIHVVSSPPKACEGAPLYLIATGAVSYSWNIGGNSATVLDHPSQGNMSYTVFGTNSFGCTSHNVYNISVNPSPNISVAGQTLICAGESTMLQAQGAGSYKWMANSIFISGNPVSVSPQVSTIYTVQGTDANGCSQRIYASVAVDACLEIAESDNVSGLRIYPNPSSGVFRIEMNTSFEKHAEITDVTGRVIWSLQTSASAFDANISNFAAGVYQVRVITDQGVSVTKILKE